MKPIGNRWILYYQLWKWRCGYSKLKPKSLFTLLYSFCICSSSILPCIQKPELPFHLCASDPLHPISCQIPSVLLSACVELASVFPVPWSSPHHLRTGLWPLVLAASRTNSQVPLTEASQWLAIGSVRVTHIPQKAGHSRGQREVCVTHICVASI